THIHPNHSSPSSTFFFCNDPAPPEIYTLSLHDALPICRAVRPLVGAWQRRCTIGLFERERRDKVALERIGKPRQLGRCATLSLRSEEHTSELQSPYDLVCRLLLEKKNKKQMKAVPQHM